MSPKILNTCFDLITNLMKTDFFVICRNILIHFFFLLVAKSTYASSLPSAFLINVVKDSTILKISTDYDCMVFLDGIRLGYLKSGPNNSKSFKIERGIYLIKAISTKGGLEINDKIVCDKNVNDYSFFLLAKREERNKQIADSIQTDKARIRDSILAIISEYELKINKSYNHADENYKNYEEFLNTLNVINELIENHEYILVETNKMNALKDLKNECDIRYAFCYLYTKNEDKINIYDKKMDKAQKANGNYYTYYRNKEFVNKFLIYSSILVAITVPTLPYLFPKFALEIIIIIAAIFVSILTFFVLRSIFLLLYSKLSVRIAAKKAKKLRKRAYEYANKEGIIDIIRQRDSQDPSKPLIKFK